MGYHCPTCNCGEPATTRRWLQYNPDDDKRDSSMSGHCSDCKDVLQRGDRNVTMVQGNTRRYFCEADALNAGWDGEYTSTLAVALLVAKAQLDAEVITLEEYLAVVDSHSA